MTYVWRHCVVAVVDETVGVEVIGSPPGEADGGDGEETWLLDPLVDGSGWPGNCVFRYHATTAATTGATSATATAPKANHRSPGFHPG